MSTKNKQIILIALSALLVVLFLFMPEQPLEVRESSFSKPSNVAEPNTDQNTESRVQAAIQIVQSENPMAGIQELLSIVSEDPSQIDAQYYLGLFSIQISEFEKAANRFKKVITFAGLKKYPDTRFQLAVCLEQLGKKDEAISELEEYYNEIGEEEIAKREAVLVEIERLRN